MAEEDQPAVLREISRFDSQASVDNGRQSQGEVNVSEEAGFLV